MTDQNLPDAEKLEHRDQTGRGQNVDDVVWGSSEPLLSNASDKYVY